MRQLSTPSGFVKRHFCRLFVTIIALLGQLLTMPASQRSMAYPPQNVSEGESTLFTNQSEPGRLRIIPNSAYIKPGQTVTIDVWLEDAENYYGLDFRLEFEKDILSVPSNKADLVWEVFDEEDHSVIKNRVDSVDSTHNRLWYVVTNIRPAEPFTGTGRLCTITFYGESPGVATLHFTYAKGGTKDGEPLYPVTEDATIMVHNVTFLPLMFLNKGIIAVPE